MNTFSLIPLKTNGLFTFVTVPQRSSFNPDGDEWRDHTGWNDSCSFDLSPPNHSQISVPKNPEQGIYASLNNSLRNHTVLTFNLHYHAKDF